MTRRTFLGSSLAAAAAPQPAALTKFQIACMTLPYSGVPFERALKGIASAGYKYVAWGTSHQRKPILAVDAPVSEAKDVAARTRDTGLDIVMMFSNVGTDAPDSVQGHTRRIEQAAAARIPCVLTFGQTKPGGFKAMVEALKQIGPVARANGVTVLLKQHGGDGATGQACAKILDAVGDTGIRMGYDAGNVLDYNNDDPIADIQACWQHVRGFAIKDHRNTPKDQDCGPGLGEIDHYKLLMPVARMGVSMPLACENIFEPVVPRPDSPEGIDALARRAREFLETVTRGVQM
jgi:sugar phosphate isomerase/epimerase